MRVDAGGDTKRVIDCRSESNGIKVECGGSDSAFMEAVFGVRSATAVWLPFEQLQSRHSSIFATASNPLHRPGGHLWHSSKGASSCKPKKYSTAKLQDYIDKIGRFGPCM